MNRFILKRQKNSIVCFLLKADYKQVFQGTEEECKKYAYSNEGLITKII